MRKHTRSVPLLAVLSLALTLPQAVLAASFYNFKGQSVGAIFDHTDDSGCIVTSMYVAAGDTRYHSEPGRPTPETWSLLGFHQYDQCNGHQVLLSGYAEGVLAEGELAVHNSATLNTTMQAFDYVSLSFIDVTIDLTWTPTGPNSRGITRTHYHGPGYNFSSYSNGSSRLAQASGSVWLGSTNLAAEPSVSGGIASSHYGEVSVNHPRAY